MTLEVRNLTKRFGGVTAIDAVTLAFANGSLSAVIGPNGAGKSTFFNLISGAMVPDSGQILVDGEDITGRSQAVIVRRGLARAFQVAQFFPTMTVRENLMAAVAVHRGQWGNVARRFPPPGARQRADEIAETLGLTESAERVAATLSHGDQKLLDVGLALALEPKILLLDEPTAGMGPEERTRMIDRLQHLWIEQKVTMVFIEHDMEIVFRIAEYVAVLCYGRLLAAGTPTAIRSDPAVIAAYLGTEVQTP